MHTPRVTQEVVGWKTGASFKAEAKLRGKRTKEVGYEVGGITIVVTSGGARAAGPSCHDGAPNLQPLTPPGQGCVQVVEGHLAKRGVVYQGRGDFSMRTIHVGQSYRGCTGKNEGSEGPCCCVWGARDHEEAGRERGDGSSPRVPTPCSQRTELPHTAFFKVCPLSHWLVAASGKTGSRDRVGSRRREDKHQLSIHHVS